MTLAYDGLDVGSEDAQRRLMCEIGLLLSAKDLVATHEGNLSCRLGDDRFLCTATEISKGTMSPDDLVVVDGDGNHVSGKRKGSSEVKMHLQIFHAMADVNAVIHAHPPHASAFAITGVEPPTGVMPEAEVLLGPVPIADYHMPSTEALAQSVLPHFRKKAMCVLMANHGAVSVGDNLLRAYWRLEALERYCRILILGRSVGEVRTIGDQGISDLLEMKRRLGLTDPRMDD